MVHVMCNEDETKLYMVHNCAFQSVLKKSRKVDNTVDCDEASV